MIRVGIAGASGYSGRELIRILLNHPEVEITGLYRSASKEPVHIADIFSEFKDKLDLVCKPLDIKDIINNTDVVFLALPHTKSMPHVKQLLDAGKKVIDISADFRIKDSEEYEKTYQTKHQCPELIDKAVYGLSEIYKDQIKKAGLIANPGCYPTSVILAVAPLAKSEFFKEESIIVDSKSGVSGAGKSLNQDLLFCEVNESVKAYKVGTHRHASEMRQEISLLAKKNINVAFTPHLVPMDRGILSTIYIEVKKGISEDKIRKQYKEFYKNSPFVRICEKGNFPCTKDVMNTNFCDIGLYLYPEKGLLTIVSCIDNLSKGASSQAVQNMNIMMGWDEGLGIL